MVAALFVATGGCYFGLPDVEPWDQARDARLYAGPHPVVAHPPCQRWGRYWHGAPRKPHQYQLGDDGGCFASALASVRRFGGILEHPKDSRAWPHHGLNAPPADGGWIVADFFGGWTCCVEQGHYGHLSRKATWLYAASVDLPDMIWGGKRAAHPSSSSCKTRVHQGPAHRDDGDGRRQTKNRNPKRDSGAIPRPAADDRAHSIPPNRSESRTTDRPFDPMADATANYVHAMALMRLRAIITAERFATEHDEFDLVAAAALARLIDRKRDVTA